MSESLIVGRVLFIGAHCDDIEIGCGGTAAKHAKAGNSIAFAVATPQGVDRKRDGFNPYFSIDDFNPRQDYIRKCLPILLSKITNKADEIYRWLYDEFEESFQRSLVQCPNSLDDILPLRSALVEQLNRIICNGSIYAKIRFTNIKMREETKELLRVNPVAEDLIYLNRLLLGDAVPELLRYHEVRRIEAAIAASLLNLSEASQTLFFGSFFDGELDQEYRQLRKWMADVADKFNPDTVFIHRNDDHTDHQAIYKVGMGAFQNKNIFLYYIPRPSPETPFDSNYAEDVSNYVQQKVGMCGCHRSQAQDYVNPDSVTTNSHYWYLRWFGRIAPRADGHAEAFIIRGWRARYSGEPSQYSDAEVPSVRYDLRLVRESDGSLRWEEG